MQSHSYCTMKGKIRKHCLLLSINRGQKKRKIIYWDLKYYNRHKREPTGSLKAVAHTRKQSIIQTHLAEDALTQMAACSEAPQYAVCVCVPLSKNVITL